VDDDDAEPELVSTVPDPDTDHLVSLDVSATFDRAAPGAVIALQRDTVDLPVPGAVAFDGDEVATFHPYLALFPETPHTATVTWGDGREYSWSFTTTSSTATPTGLSPDGLTFSWDLSQPGATVISPPNGASLIAQLGLGNLFTEFSQPGTDLFVLGGQEDASTPGTQDLCLESFDLTDTSPATFVDPFFQAGPVALTRVVPIGTFNVAVTLKGLELSGDFSTSGGSAINAVENGSLYGWIDVRDFGLPIVCSGLGILLGVTIPCNTCPGEPGIEECVTISVQDMVAPVVPGLDLVERSASDIAQDLNCP
jgi:hypothetical protein